MPNLSESEIAALAQFGISGQDIEAAISEPKRGPGRPPLDPAEREKRLEQEREHKIQTTAILAEARKEVLREKARIAAEERAQRNAMKIELARVRAEEKETARLRRAEDMRIAREAREAAAAAVREEKRAKRERAREAKERELDARRAQRAKEYTKRIAEKAEAKARERAASLAALEERRRGWTADREKKRAEKAAERKAREAKKKSRYDKFSPQNCQKMYERSQEQKAYRVEHNIKPPMPTDYPAIKPLEQYDDGDPDFPPLADGTPYWVDDVERHTDVYRAHTRKYPEDSLVFPVRDYVPEEAWLGNIPPWHLRQHEWVASHPGGDAATELVTWQEWFAIAMFDGLTEDVLRGLLGAKQGLLRNPGGLRPPDTADNPYALPPDASSNFEPGSG